MKLTSKQLSESMKAMSSAASKKEISEAMEDLNRLQLKLKTMLPNGECYERCTEGLTEVRIALRRQSNSL